METELMKEMPLIEMDKKTSQYQNEQDLRRDPFFREEILSFLLEKRKYIEAIQDDSQKGGKITLAYPSRNSNCGMLSPLYHEDLETLNMQEVEALTFIRKVKMKVQDALKSKSGEDVVAFFRTFGWIYSTTYNINKGYYRNLRILSHANLIDCIEGEKLLKIFRESLEVSEEKNVEQIYFRARNIYDYAKKQHYFPKKVVENLTVTSSIPNESMKLKKKQESVYLSSFNQFLDEHIEKHPNQHARLSDLALEYEIERGERSNLR